MSGPLAQPVMAYWTGRVSKSASASAMHMRSKRAFFIVLEARRYQSDTGMRVQVFFADACRYVGGGQGRRAGEQDEIAHSRCTVSSPRCVLRCVRSLSGSIHPQYSRRERRDLLGAGRAARRRRRRPEREY